MDGCVVCTGLLTDRVPLHSDHGRRKAGRGAGAASAERRQALRTQAERGERGAVEKRARPVLCGFKWAHTAPDVRLAKESVKFLEQNLF